MGKVLKIILIVFLIIVLLIVAVGVYFYYFHVFKTFRVCISNEIENTPVECKANEECFNMIVNRSAELKEAMEMVEIAPDFIKEKISGISEEAAYCESTCKIKRIYGDLTGEKIESCNPGDKEIKIEIRGKEGLQIFNLMRKNPDIKGLDF